MSTYSDISGNFEASNGDILISEDQEAIENSIGNILDIKRGTVPGNPEIGSILWEFIGEFIDEITFVGMREAILNALLDQEPRIIVQSEDSIEITYYESMNIVILKIEYVLLSNNRVYIYEKSIEV